MKGKIAFVLGATVGYVLGSRAGRERYEQIKRGAQQVWETEPVQRGVDLVKGALDERADDLRAFVGRAGADLFTGFAQPKTKSQPQPTVRSGGAARTEAAAPADAASADASDTDASDADASEAETGAAKSAAATRSSSTRRAPAKSTAKRTPAAKPAGKPAAQRGGSKRPPKAAS